MGVVLLHRNESRLQKRHAGLYCEGPVVRVSRSDDVVILFLLLCQSTRTTPDSLVYIFSAIGLLVPNEPPNQTFSVNMALMIAALVNNAIF